MSAILLQLCKHYHTRKSDKIRKIDLEKLEIQEKPTLEKIGNAVSKQEARILKPRINQVQLFGSLILGGKHLHGLLFK